MIALLRSLLVCLMICAATAATATDDVRGTVTEYQSWYGTPETCVRISPMPGAFYDLDDVDDEKALCAIDLYAEDVAICPKIWSTSAAVIIYDIGGSKFEGDRTGFQTKICEIGRAAEYVADDEYGRIKFSMNQRDTSATFAPAPLLYYHLSRYFGAEVKVPVSVWRSMDGQVLLGEVAQGGLDATSVDPELVWNHNAWYTIVRTLREPAYYRRHGTMGDYRDLLTADREQAYGVLLDATDPRFGPEVNGITPVDWNPTRRYHYFQQTPPFIALTTDAPLAEAIEAGLVGAVPPLAETRPQDPGGPSPAQMVFWMRELSETVLMDYILGQQDRPGNIDRKPYYYWVSNGMVFRKKAKGRTPGEGEIPADALLIERMVLNDNDAAGRSEYINFSKRAMALERFRHFDANVYRQLLALNADFRAQGPAFAWLRDSLGLTEDQVAMIVDNTRRAAEVLSYSCSSGELRFDLDPLRVLATGRLEAEDLPCLPEL